MAPHRLGQELLNGDGVAILMVFTAHGECKLILHLHKIATEDLPVQYNNNNIFAP